MPDSQFKFVCKLLLLEERMGKKMSNEYVICVKMTFSTVNMTMQHVHTKYEKKRNIRNKN